MNELARRALCGVRPLDWVLAGALTALGAVLMVENVQLPDDQVAAAIADGSMVHPLSTHTWWMVPVFLLTTIPVLWWRRSVVAVTGIALAAVVAHDLLFGWVTRCGAGLPLVFVLAYLAGYAGARAGAYVALGLAVLLTCAMLVRDATTGLEPVVLALPIVLIVFGVGWAVRARTAMNAELRDRNEALRALRDQRAALEVNADRVRLSQELDGLLQERLARLGRAAASADRLDPVAARTVLEEIEAGGRRTLDDMREIVGLLRGGDAALAPAPTVAHIDAMLAARTSADTRVTVSGDPGAIPATVELSAYRIVEHLVGVLADDPRSPIEVGIRFADDALELRVAGPVAKGTDLKTAAARARQRAELHHGTVDLRVGRGQASAIAQLPLTPAPR